MGKDLNGNFPKEDRWMAKDCMHRCSTSEVIHWGNAVKAIIRHNSNPPGLLQWKNWTITRVGKAMEKLFPS